MFTDLNSEIKFLRDQLARKDTYFHEEKKFLRQQLETALSKQENLNIGFCNNPQHIPSNIDSDDSFIMTDYYTDATSSDNNIQTDNYINNKNTDNTVGPPSTKNSQEDYTSSHISKPTSSVNKSKMFILGDCMVKYKKDGTYLASYTINIKFMFVHFHQLK